MGMRRMWNNDLRPCPCDMKTPLPVRLVAVLFGLWALFSGIVCIQGFVQSVSEQPWDIQVIWVMVGLMISGVPAWLAAGLWRRSLDARAIVLTLCWVAFVGLPIRMAAYYSRESMEEVCVRLVVMAAVVSVYRMLTRASVRSWFLEGMKGVS